MGVHSGGAGRCRLFEYRSLFEHLSDDGPDDRPAGEHPHHHAGPLDHGAELDCASCPHDDGSTDHDARRFDDDPVLEHHVFEHNVDDDTLDLDLDLDFDFDLDHHDTLDLDVDVDHDDPVDDDDDHTLDHDHQAGAADYQAGAAEAAGPP